LSERDGLLVLDLPENPPPANAKLRAAIARYRKLLIIYLFLDIDGFAGVRISLRLPGRLSRDRSGLSRDRKVSNAPLYACLE
jgi:hypothetical protein